MPIKVFISYSWDSKEHQDWVVDLTNTLRKTYGIDAKCDALLDEPNLFSMMVQESKNNDKIIIVDTNRYTEKANNEQGGVGYETKLFYNYFQQQPKKLIVIKRDMCNLPFYLSGWKYIDFTKGMTTETLDELVLRINGKPSYKMAPLSDSPRIVNSKVTGKVIDDNIIPDLRAVSQSGKDDYLQDQFNIADETILDLLRQTKQKNPELIVEHEKINVNLPTGSSIIIGNSLKQQINYYTVCTYNIKYQDKKSYYKIWLSLNNYNNINGIYGTSDLPLFSINMQEFNSYQLWAHVSSSTKLLRLECTCTWNSNVISNGKELGAYIFKNLINKIQS